MAHNYTIIDVYDGVFFHSLRVVQGTSTIIDVYDRVFSHSLRVVQGTSTIIDSGELWDTTISGGRLGVMTFGIGQTSFSNLVARCVDQESLALYLNGTGEYVEIGDITTRQMEERYDSLNIRL